ncbi:MAG TPA: hypothetical protein VIQ24_10200 [Pyrinomonadaceae bacterium]
MIELNDTKSNADEAASKAQGGDERAAARTGEAFASNGADGMDGVDDASHASAPGASSIAAADAVMRDPQPALRVEPDVEPLVLQSGFQASDKSQYHVTELLSYHDRHFVESVYQAILGRAPFPAEGESALDELRGGRAGKVEIIERLLSSPEARAAGRGVRIEGLPSPAMRRLGRVPVVGYVLRLVRALVRLPLLMQHQQQFEIYALAQQQLIVDYLNRTLAQFAHRSEVAADAHASEATGDAPAPPVLAPSQHEEIAETLAMFSDALLEVSNSHAELQAQTQTQAEQAQDALAELTEAVTAQQQLAETFRREHQLAADALRRNQQLAADALRREQQLAADAQQEFLIQEQRVIVETQRLVLEELREELRALSERQQRARDEFDAELRRLQSLRETARENFSGQT